MPLKRVENSFLRGWNTTLVEFDMLFAQQPTGNKKENARRSTILEVIVSNTGHSVSSHIKHREES